jgi:hypothetical protein
MKIEIIILAVVIFLVANTYYDGKLLNTLYSWKKYYQMGFYIIGGVGIYLLFKHNPTNGKQLFICAQNVIKNVPIDKNSKDFLSPLLDLSSKYCEPTNIENINTIPAYEKRILNSGKQTTKRSVSETKKKYIASQQDWKCKDCKCKLPAWFEVDHITRLEYGGTNNVDNLVALCRDCHGKKTAFENL